MDSGEMLGRLIGFDTVSRKSNLAAIDFIRDYLDGFGIASRLTFDDAGAKANLFATIGPADRPGVILSGHSDVVPVDDQNWSSDPFAMDERDGKLFGRGASDMKGFIATALALVPAFQERAKNAPIHLAFSYDEEVGCIGVNRLIRQIGMAEAPPFACVVGEPTRMEPIVGQKGLHVVRCRVQGKEAHSSRTPYGVNAVEAAAELIARIAAIGRRVREEGPFDHGFDPPFSTVHCGTVRGGAAQNIVPAHCEFTYEIRNLPGHDPATVFAEIERHAHEAIEPAMRAVDPDAGFTFVRREGLPDYRIDEDHPAVSLVKQALGANDVGHVSYMTEAGLFGRAGIPTVICGPGDIAQAHKPDEFIEASEIARCETFLLRLAASVGR
jgi:acetylornithine deacetylase